MQTIKDKHDFIAGYGTAVVAILGNVATNDYELVDLASVPFPPETEADFNARSLGFVGTLGLVCGQFRSAFAVSLERDIVDALAKSYFEFICAKFANAPQSSPAGDGADWLKALYNLPDNREETN